MYRPHPRPTTCPAALALFMCATSACLDCHDHNRACTHCEEDKTDITTTLTMCSRHAPRAPDMHPALQTRTPCSRHTPCAPDTCPVTHQRAPAPLTCPPLLDMPPPPQTCAVCLSMKGHLPAPPHLFLLCLAGVLVRVPRRIAVPSHSPVSSQPSYRCPSPCCPSRLAASNALASHMPPSTSILGHRPHLYCAVHWSRRPSSSLVLAAPTHPRPHACVLTTPHTVVCLTCIHAATRTGCASPSQV